MEMASRHDSTQYRGETTEKILEESESYSNLMQSHAQKQDTIHLQLDNLEEEEYDALEHVASATETVMKRGGSANSNSYENESPDEPTVYK